MKKICLTCKEEKLEDEFHWENKKKNNRRVAHCKPCTRMRARNRYKINGNAQRRRSKIRSREKRAISRHYHYEILSNSFCADCGNNNPIVLEFDHVRGEKKYEISRLISIPMSLDVLKEEIKKCDIVCANCHKIRTAKAQNWHKYVKHGGAGIRYGTKDLSCDS